MSHDKLAHIGWPIRNHHTRQFIKSKHIELHRNNNDKQSQPFATNILFVNQVYPIQTIYFFFYRRLRCVRFSLLPFALSLSTIFTHPGSIPIIFHSDKVFLSISNLGSFHCVLYWKKIKKKRSLQAAQDKRALKT